MCERIYAGFENTVQLFWKIKFALKYILPYLWKNTDRDIWLCTGSTVVEFSTHTLKMVGSNPRMHW